MGIQIVESTVSMLKMHKRERFLQYSFVRYPKNYIFTAKESHKPYLVVHESFETFYTLMMYTLVMVGCAKE